MANIKLGPTFMQLSDTAKLLDNANFIHFSSFFSRKIIIKLSIKVYFVPILENIIK